MCKLAVHDATHLDARALAANIRAEDAEEVKATSVSGDVLEAILLCIRRSVTTHAVYAGDDLLFIGGLIPFEKPGEAIGWLLSTKAVEKHWRDVVRETKQMLPALLTGFSVVYNYVDVRYTKSINWLIWAGFATGPVYAMAPHGMPFVKMSLKVGK